jgi:flagellar motor switch protein FliG
LTLDKELAARAIERMVSMHKVAEANADIHKVITLNRFREQYNSEKSLQSRRQLQQIMQGITSPKRQVPLEKLTGRLRVNYFTLRGRGLLREKARPVNE